MSREQPDRESQHGEEEEETEDALQLVQWIHMNVEEKKKRESKRPLPSNPIPIPTHSSIHPLSRPPQEVRGVNTAIFHVPYFTSEFLLKYALLEAQSRYVGRDLNLVLTEHYGPVPPRYDTCSSGQT